MPHTTDDHIATACNLMALVSAGRTADTMTVLGAMDDAERSHVFIASLHLAAGFAQRNHIANGWDPEETPELLHATALRFLANKGATDD